MSQQWYVCMYVCMHVCMYVIPSLIGFVWPARNGTVSDTATVAAGSDSIGSAPVPVLKL